MAFPLRTFPFDPKLKCSPTYAPCLNGLISNSTFLFVSTILQHSVWPVFLSNARHLPRAPLPAQGVTSHGVMSMHDIRERYLSFIAHTGSCARPSPSYCLGSNLEQQVFAGCGKPLLGDGPSRHYLCNPFPPGRDWTPTPQCPPSALARFFLGDNGLT